MVRDACRRAKRHVDALLTMRPSESLKPIGIWKIGSGTPVSPHG
jgi:hypothetical protein